MKVRGGVTGFRADGVGVIGIGDIIGFDGAVGVGGGRDGAGSGFFLKSTTSGTEDAGSRYSSTGF